MNCTEFKDTFTYLSTGDIESGLDKLASELQAQFETHQQGCSACQSLYVDGLEAELAADLDAQLVSKLGGDDLKRMLVPDPSLGFADRVLLTAVTANEADKTRRHPASNQRNGFFMGFGSAAVAAMALWVASDMFPGSEITSGQSVTEQLATEQVSESATKQIVAVLDEAVTKNTPIKSTDSDNPVMSIVLHQKQDIKLAFFSAEPLTGAKITIHLPENVALVGYPGRRELSWTTNLKKGDNLLRLPIIATQIARGDLVANIEYENKMKTLTLSLESFADETST